MKALVAFCVVGLLLVPAQAHASRRKAVAETLDHYFDKRHPEVVLERKRVAQEKQRAKEVRIQEKKERHQARKQRIKEVLTRFHPHISVGESFNDNIFRVSSGEREDYLTVVDPGLRYEWKAYGSQSQFKADGGVELQSYADNSQYNIQNPYVDVLSDYQIGYGLLKSRYHLKRHQISVSDISDSTLEAMTTYWQDTYSFDFGFDANRVVWGLGYDHSAVVYKDQYEKDDSKRDDEIVLRGGWRVSPKTQLFLKYGHGMIDYHKGGEGNSTYNRIWMGVNGRITSKITGLAQFGYQVKEYEDDGGDLNSVVTGIDLTYKAKENIRYLIKVKRELKDSTYSTRDGMTDTQFSLGCAYMPPLSNRLRVGLEARYQDSTYDSGREAEILGGSFTTEYIIRKWLKLVGEYEFREKTSTTKTAEYTNNIVSMKLVSEF